MNNHQIEPDFATYSTSVTGFIHIVLKWREERGVAVGEYIQAKGLIKPWRFKRLACNAVDFRNEIPRFQKWVRETYADDPQAKG